MKKKIQRALFLRNTHHQASEKYNAVQTLEIP